MTEERKRERESRVRRVAVRKRLVEKKRWRPSDRTFCFDQTRNAACLPGRGLFQNSFPTISTTL